MLLRDGLDERQVRARFGVKPKRCRRFALPPHSKGGASRSKKWSRTSATSLSRTSSCTGSSLNPSSRSENRSVKIFIWSMAVRDVLYIGSRKNSRATKGGITPFGIPPGALRHSHGPVHPTAHLADATHGGRRLAPVCVRHTQAGTPPSYAYGRRSLNPPALSSPHGLHQGTKSKRT